MCVSVWLVSTDSAALLLHPKHSSLGTRLIRFQGEKAASISSSRVQKGKVLPCLRIAPSGSRLSVLQKMDRGESSKNGVLTSVYYMLTERSGASHNCLLSLSLPTHK